MKNEEETKEHKFWVDLDLPYVPAPRTFEESMRSIARLTARRQREVLKKSKYDIDFIIRVLKDQLIVIDREKLRPSSIALTMSHSIKSLLAFLEVEKMNEMKPELNEDLAEIESCIEFLESAGYKVIKN